MEGNREQRRVSVIIPVYNEESNISKAYEAVRGVFAKLPRHRYEIVFTDNHSSDKTFEMIRAICASDPAVKALRFSKNFGFQNSVLTGYLHCTGDAAIQMDCDLQDPPEVILEFVRLWEQGYKIAYGIRRRRRENPLMNLTRKFFYRFLNLIGEEDLPVDSGEFRLIDRVVIDEIKKIDDASPYLRGAISSMGFRQIGVPFDRHQRSSGTSKLSLRDYFEMAANGILNHSVAPLRLATYIGLLLGMVSLGLIVAFLSSDLSRRLHSSGIDVTTLIVLLTASMNALFLGIIGEYLGRIYRQVKRRPNTIIEETINTPREMRS